MPSSDCLVDRVSPASAAASAAAFPFLALTLSLLALGTLTASAAEPAASGTSPPTPPAATAVAPAKSYVSIGEKPAVMFDAPSDRANKNFIVQRGTPLETLVKLGKWTKVRDVDGSVGWIENSALGTVRNVLVSTGFAEIRSEPQATAALVFEAQRGVLLEATGTPIDGWLPVRHRDGQAGFVKQSQVWGD